jgi:23S rRNA (cytosine1962-C5)-methyltransferase
VVVNGHAAGWLRRGFPWVYPDEVAGGGGRRGETVRIVDASGEELGRGVADDGWIAVRRFRADPGPLDAAWADAALDRAVRLRERAVLGPDTTCARLVHGENDHLPGVRVDAWGSWLSLVLDTPALVPLLDVLVPGLVRRLSPRGIRLSFRPDPRDKRDRGVFPASRWLWGEPPAGEVVVKERGMALRVRLDDAPDVGAFPDMRDVRCWLEPHVPGRRVLNLFCYTGAFSVAADRAGAASVTSVDLARPVLDRLVANLVENRLDVTRHELLAEDSFKALDRLRRTGRRFDLVIVDPPSFSHGPEGAWSAEQDLPRLVAACVRVLDTDGWLVVASNHGQTAPRAFRGAVHDGLQRVGRAARELALLGAAIDHPAGAHFPEGHYLKVGVWALD